MSNYDKPLDQVVKDQKKAKFQAKKKQAGKAAMKAKIGKGGKKPVGGRNQVAKNRNFGNKPVGRNNANRNGKPQGRNNVARNSAPMKKQLIRKNVSQGARNNNRGPQRANIPRAGLRSASAMAKTGGIMTGLKVHIDNLDWGVTEKDMRELFGEFGGLKTVQMHFDSKGKSQGVCDIHFKNRTDGLRAVKKYNNVPLDGRRMKIDVVGQPGLPVVTNKVQAAKQFVKQKVAPNKKFSPAKKQQMNKKPAGKKLVGKAKNSPSPKKKILLKKGGKGGKPGQKKETRKPVSEEDLDKQLDAYLAAGSN